MTLAAFKRLCTQCKIHDLRVMNSDLEKVFKKHTATEKNKFINYDQFQDIISDIADMKGCTELDLRA